jgi:hypothetical protein
MLKALYTASAMMAIDFSYAQSLRVVGQALQALQIDSFRLEKTDTEYIVRMEHTLSAGKLVWETNFIKTIAEKIWGPGEFEEKLNTAVTTGSLAYTSADIERLDNEGQSSRRGQDSMPDTRNMSLPLRVLGDYLDHKGARDFAISWSADLVKVQYMTIHHDLKEENFTPQNLYDRGVHMYLRRSKHSPVP